MNVLLRRVVIPFVAVALLWLVVCIAIGTGVEALFGEWRAERFMPFGNAHLLEEAYEGSYVPLADPVFLLLAVAIGIFVFGIGTYFAALGASRNQLPYAAIPALIALALLAWMHRYVWHADYPLAMFLGAVVQFGVFFSASLAGLLLAVHHASHRASGAN